MKKKGHAQAFTIHNTTDTKKNPENKIQSGKGTKEKPLDLRLCHNQEASSQRQQLQGWRFLQTNSHTSSLLL
jgi:hypothetical protein